MTLWLHRNRPKPQARPGDMAVITTAAQRVKIATAAVLGGLAVLLWQHGADNLAEAVPVVQEEKAKHIAACKLPSEEGQMTVFVIEGGVRKCWRWQ